MDRLQTNFWRVDAVMGLHIYFGNDHHICPMCGFELPIEYFIIIGKILICRGCAEGLK